MGDQQRITKTFFCESKFFLTVLDRSQRSPEVRNRKRIRTNTVSHGYRSHSSLHYGFHQSGYRASPSESKHCMSRMCENFLDNCLLFVVWFPHNKYSGLVECACKKLKI